MCVYGNILGGVEEAAEVASFGVSGVGRRTSRCKEGFALKKGGKKGKRNRIFLLPEGNGCVGCACSCGASLPAHPGWLQPNLWGAAAPPQTGIGIAGAVFVFPQIPAVLLHPFSFPSPKMKPAPAPPNPQPKNWEFLLLGDGAVLFLPSFHPLFFAGRDLGPPKLFPPAPQKPHVGSGFGCLLPGDKSRETLNAMGQGTGRALKKKS